MLVPCHCNSCGLDFLSGAIQAELGGQIELKNTKTRCPRCGQLADIQDGLYGAFGLVNRVVETARAPGVSRDNLEAFQTIAKAAQAGEISAEVALEQAGQIGSVFGALLKWADDNGAALTLLLTVLAVVINLYGVIAADDGSAQSHSDAQKQLNATFTLQQIEEKISEELQKSMAGGSATPSNRHERRKAARLEGHHRKKH